MNAAAPPSAAARVGRRLRGMSRYTLVVVLLAVIGGVYALAAPRGHAADGQTQKDAVAAGYQLFLTGCSSCHGLHAEGGNRAPSLIGVGAAMVDFQLGTGRMPLMNRGAQAVRKTPRYTQGEIDQISAYIASLAPGPAIPSNLDYKKGNLQEGLELFQANCAACHQVAGMGGVLTYGKFAPSLTAATPKQMYEAMTVGPENMPVFGDNIISPDKKLAIINYLMTQRSEANPGGMGLGRTGPVAEGLVAWTAGILALVGLCMWIGKRI